jgi:hypothetical protein
MEHWFHVLGIPCESFFDRRLQPGSSVLMMSIFFFSGFQNANLARMNNVKVNAGWPADGY